MMHLTWTCDLVAFACTSLCQYDSVRFSRAPPVFVMCLLCFLLRRLHSRLLFSSLCGITSQNIEQHAMVGNTVTDKRHFKGISKEKV